MKYRCLVYREEKRVDAMSRPAGLQPVRTATTVRMRHGKVTTTDGPFAETKEQLGGFFLISAQDLDEAILVASRIPAARLGSIEIRPIRESEQP